MSLSRNFSNNASSTETLAFLIIREWWENQDTVTLITRPRRFGKTLNLNMLDCFFSRKYEGRGDLFEGLSIWDDEKSGNSFTVFS